MSNVLSRFRSLSELEWWKNGIEIRARFVRFLMNENKVPKRWRHVFSFPGVDLTIKLMQAIVAANTIYPISEAEVEQRRAFQNEAIIACEQMIEHMQFMIDVLDNVKVSDFTILYNMLIKEIKLLKGWRKTNKVLTSKIEDEKA